MTNEGSGANRGAEMGDNESSRGDVGSEVGVSVLFVEGESAASSVVVVVFTVSIVVSTVRGSLLVVFDLAVANEVNDAADITEPPPSPS